MDLHGGAIFYTQRNNSGWPPLVKLVLNETKSANYETNMMPRNVTMVALRELQRFKLSLMQRYAKHAKDKLFDKNHSSISMGFKAPVSMTLLPLLLTVFKEVRFIRKCWLQGFLSLTIAARQYFSFHIRIFYLATDIVRDGRDVSLSDNRSPVYKFCKCEPMRKKLFVV